MSARSYDLHGGTEFEELAERYRRELQIHCYRITGSVQDTEDLVQETLLAGISGCRGRCLSIWATTVRDQGARPNRKRSTTMARYLLSTHTIDGEERPPMTDDEMEQFMTRIGALEEEMRSAGAWVFSGRLHGPETATVVRSNRGEVLTTDGTFAEAKEYLGGFYIVEAEGLDAALAWGAKTSECIMRPIEVRPFMHTAGA